MIDPILSCRFGYQTSMYKRPIKLYTPDKDEQDFISTLDHPLRMVKHVYQCGKQETKKRQKRDRADDHRLQGICKSESNCQF